MAVRRTAMNDASFIYIIALVLGVIGFIMGMGAGAISASEVYAVVLLTPTWLLLFLVEWIFKKATKFGRLFGNITVIGAITGFLSIVVNLYASNAKNADGVSLESTLAYVILVYFLSNLIAAVLVQLVLFRKIPDDRTGKQANAAAKYE